MADADRLTKLELLFTHLERQVADLHSVVLQQQAEIELLTKELRRFQSAAAGEGQEAAGDDG